MKIKVFDPGDLLHTSEKETDLFSRCQVTGIVTDKSGVARWVLQGTWDDEIQGAPVLKTVEHPKGKVVYETGMQKRLWKKTPAP